MSICIPAEIGRFRYSSAGGSFLCKQDPKHESRGFADKILSLIVFVMLLRTTVAVEIA